MQDDKGSLAALGGLAYLLTMLLHEGVGHSVACAFYGGHPILTPCATQCEVQSHAMVLAGPLLNLVSGAVAWWFLGRTSPARPHVFWLLWLLMAMNWFLFTGYLALGGALGFGDWAVLATGLVSPWVWRPLFLVSGLGLYYGTLVVSARRLPGMGNDPSSRPERRLRTLTLLPYLGAGLVACCAGLFNPLGTPFLVLPIATSFGAFWGLLSVGGFRRGAVKEEERRLAPVTRNARWLIGAVTAIVLFVALVGPGLHLRP
jgi:hypothetical protein